MVGKRLVKSGLILSLLSPAYLSLNLSEHQIKEADLKVDDHYWYNGAN
jgi:hypothetical protein